jgi:hypothetical protein
MFPFEGTVTLDFYPYAQPQSALFDLGALARFLA